MMEKMQKSYVFCLYIFLYIVMGFLNFSYATDPGNLVDIHWSRLSPVNNIVYVVADMTFKDGYHAYGENDFARRPTFNFLFSNSWKYEEMRWSLPSYMTVAKEEIIGYPHHVQFIFSFLRTDQTGEDLFLKGSVSLVLCGDLCVPVKKVFFLHYEDLPLVAIQPEVVPTIKKFNLTSNGERYILHVSFGSSNVQAFIPAISGLTVVNKPEHNGDEWVFSFVSTALPSMIPIFFGAKGAIQGAYAYLVPNAQDMVMIWILLGAFLGGFLLNAMPCSLPLLLLKLRSVGSDKKGILFFMGGVFSSFIVFGLLIYVFNMMGIYLGFGAQFQNPAFLFLVGLIICCMIAGILDFYPIFDKGAELLKSLNIFEHKLLGQFFYGVFLTFITTPCSGPFLGSALSFAMLQPPMTAFFIFIAMGLGVIFPYGFFLVFPHLLDQFKTGAWIIYLKKASALFAFSFVLWIASIFYYASPYFWEVIVAWVVLTVCFVYLLRNTAHRFFIQGLGILVACILASVVFLAVFGSKESPNPNLNSNMMEGFLPYSEVLFQQAQRDHRPILINVTALWCMNCRINDLVFFSDSEVQNFLKEKKFLVMRLDFTHRNATTEKFMQQNHVYGIPLNQVIDSCGHKILFTSFLTKEIFYQKIKNLCPGL